MGHGSCCTQWCPLTSLACCSWARSPRPAWHSLPTPLHTGGEGRAQVQLASNIKAAKMSGTAICHLPQPGPWVGTGGQLQGLPWIKTPWSQPLFKSQVISMRPLSSGRAECRVVWVVGQGGNGPHLACEPHGGHSWLVRPCPAQSSSKTWLRGGQGDCRV